MKLHIRCIVFGVVVIFFLSACGYRNPYVYSGPEKDIYVTTWKNRTSNLQLSAQVYQELLKWFQKSRSLKVTKNKDGSDFILAGEIVSIDIPSLAYNAGNSASEVKLTLKVRYIFKELASEKVLIEKASETWTETYPVTSDATETQDNANEALEKIIEDMSQKIYQRALVEIAKI